MKTTIFNLIIGWVLSNFLLACSSGQGEQQGVYEGTDIKKEFIAEHSGEYVFSDEWRDYGSTRSITINSDETFEIKFENYKIDAGDKLGRTAVCSGVRRGRIFYVKKIDADVDHLTTGYTTYFFGKSRHLDAYLYLSESKFEFTETKTERYSSVTQRSEHLTGDLELTKDEYMNACGSWARTNPEVVHIERILPNALVVSDVWRGRNVPVTQRFAMKKKDDWVWITGSFARSLIAEASERLSVSLGGVRAFEVEPDTLKFPKRQFDLKAKIETDAAQTFKLSFGTDVLERFYPMMTLEGQVVGVSYRPSTKDFVMHVRKPLTVTVSSEKASFYDLDNSVREMMTRESSKFFDLKQAITKDEHETVQIGINMGGTKVLNIFSKDETKE